jgi:hypothetical protein
MGKNLNVRAVKKCKGNEVRKRAKGAKDSPFVVLLERQEAGIRERTSQLHNFEISKDCILEASWREVHGRQLRLIPHHEYDRDTIRKNN